MAQKTLRQFSAPSNSHIPTGLNNYQGTDDFEIKTRLVNMVQASPFCGKASEDANAHLQNFLEVSSIINPNNGDVGSRSSVKFWITLVVGGERHTDPASDPKTRIQQS